MPLLETLRAALTGPRATHLTATPTLDAHPPDHLVSTPAREALDDDRAWRSPTGSARELPDTLRRDQLLAVDQAWRSDPLANRIVELTCDLVLGSGVTIRAEHPEVQAIVDAFWSHPLNRMQLRQLEWCNELTLTGELFVAFFTNPVDAMTYVRAVPATLIDQIDTDPDDLERELRFHQLPSPAAGARPPTSAPGPRPPAPGTQPFDKTPPVGTGAPAPLDGRWWDAADMRHYAINRLLGTTRGQGDLVPVLPWLRYYREWLADRVRINRYKGAYLWDVTIHGTDRAALLARQAELVTPPSPGSLIFHNDSEEWRAVTPNIDASDVAADGKALRRLIAAGAGVPLHFLAEADEGNRAVAREQARPTNLHFQRRQLTFGLVLVDVCREVVRRSGRVPPDRVGRLEPVFPDTEPSDNVQLAQAAFSAARALQLAQSNGWLDVPAATTLFHQFLGGIAPSPPPSPGNGRAEARPG